MYWRKETYCMKHITSLWACFVCVLVLALCQVQPLFAQEEPVLEEYTISHGGAPGVTPAGITAELSDKFFGNGTATALLQFVTKNDASELSLQVRRKVKRRDFAFALLVFRVEVRGFDLEGMQIYSQDLSGFSFGDSRSGRWSEKLEGLPANIQRIQVTFIGNYE